MHAICTRQQWSTSDVYAEQYSIVKAHCNTTAAHWPLITAAVNLLSSKLLAAVYSINYSYLSIQQYLQIHFM
jgi:hypothetical protein